MTISRQCTSPPGPSVTRILLVDNDPDITALVSYWVGALPWYRLGVAADGAGGVSKLASGNWDVLIVDLHMPGVDGFHLANMARLMQPDLHVVLMTGDNTVAVNDLGAHGVFDRVLTKPVVRDALIDSLKPGATRVADPPDTFIRSASEYPKWFQKAKRAVACDLSGKRPCAPYIEIVGGDR